jgi:hypothetical protein
MGAGARAIGLVGRGAVFAAVLWGAAACSQTARQSMPCPEVKVVRDASYLTRFAGESEDLTDTAFEAKIGLANQVCHYQVNEDTKKTTILTDLQVRLEASRGPKNTDGKADLKYLVSVTGPGGSHVGDPKWSNTFDVSIPLTADKPTNGIVDTPSIAIPIGKDQNGDFYRIYVYLALSEKELAYNRRNPQQ